MQCSLNLHLPSSVCTGATTNVEMLCDVTLLALSVSFNQTWGTWGSFCIRDLKINRTCRSVLNGRNCLKIETNKDILCGQNTIKHQMKMLMSFCISIVLWDKLLRVFPQTKSIIDLSFDKLISDWGGEVEVCRSVFVRQKLQLNDSRERDREKTLLNLTAYKWLARGDCDRLWLDDKETELEEIKKTFDMWSNPDWSVMHRCRLNCQSVCKVVI